MARDRRYDLTFLKTSELAAGAGAAVVGDKFIMIDVSDAENPVTRTLQDIVDLANAGEANTFSAQVEVTLAELNAGKTIIAAVAGKQILVTDFNIVCDGAFGDLTSAELEDSSATVNICSLAQAQMTDDAILFKGATGVTPGVGLGEGLTISEACVITKTGSDAITATKLTVAITWILV